MKSIQGLACAAVIAAASGAFAGDVITTGDGGLTVIDTVTTAAYGTTTMTWSANANFAASLTPASPYWVPGINPDGSMPLSVAIKFVAKLNQYSYLNISTWSLPMSVPVDQACTLNSAGGNFGYNCGMAPPPANSAYPYNQMGGLFYNVLGGSANANIALNHNADYALFNHVQPYLCWSGTQQGNNPHFAYDFWFQNGFEGTEDVHDAMFVWPVSTVTTGTPPSQLIATPDPNGGLGLDTIIDPGAPTLVPSPDGSLVYDPRLNVTFLANGNLAQALLKAGSPYAVAGINPDGSMNAATLVNFLAALNNPAHPFMGRTGWMVPLVAQDGIDSSCTLANVSAGQLQAGGYNCSGLSATNNGTASQLGELFYDQLGGKAGVDLYSHANSDLGFFQNLQMDYYWQCQPLPTDPPGQCDLLQPGGDPSFSFLSGYQGSQTHTNDLFVILELPGDAVVPEPATWISLLSGLSIVGVGLRRKVRAY